MSTSKFRPMANVNGNLTPLEEARISVLDRGFLYGDSVYEVFRTYAGVPLFYEAHFDRLKNSAALIQMEITQSHDELIEEIRRCIQASGAIRQDVFVRYHITRGGNSIDLLPKPDLTTNFVIMVKNLVPWNPEFYSQGMKLAVVKVRRNPMDALDPNIKSGNYLNNILALNQAISQGADDCLMLNHYNMATESSNSNVFFVLDGQLVTPSPRAGILRGITKAAILGACAVRGLAVTETDILVDQLRDTSECFVSSATREVMPVRSLLLPNGDQIDFPPGGGPITRQVAAYYRAVVSEHVKQSEHLRMVM